MISKASERFLKKLFDIIPGLIEFKPYSSRSYSDFLAKYETESAASYAIKKLNNFELTSGDRINVEYYDRTRSSGQKSSSNEISQSTIDQIKNLIELNGKMSNIDSTLLSNVSLQQDQLLQQNVQLMLMSNLMSGLSKVQSLTGNESLQSTQNIYVIYFN